MKVTVSDNQSQQEKEIKFPLLMQKVLKGTIVLFLNETTGVVVHSDDSSDIGYYSDNYCLFDDRKHWKPLPNGVKVTLENDL